MSVINCIKDGYEVTITNLIESINFIVQDSKSKDLYQGDIVCANLKGDDTINSVFNFIKKCLINDDENFWGGEVQNKYLILKFESTEIQKIVFVVLEINILYSERSIKYILLEDYIEDLFRQARMEAVNQEDSETEVSIIEKKKNKKSKKRIQE
jgi:hypothetical protein